LIHDFSEGGFSCEIPILSYIIVIVVLALIFDYSNGFHDAANVVATIIGTGALSARKALIMAATCEFIGPFILERRSHRQSGKASSTYLHVRRSHGRSLHRPPHCRTRGAIAWEPQSTWFWGIPSSSSHALVGGMVGAVLVAYGPT